MPRKDGRPRSLPLFAVPRNEEVAKLFPSAALSEPEETEDDDAS